MFDPADGGWAARPAFESGAGGLVSTLDDYLAFAQALLDGGGPILSRSSVAAMTTDQLYAVDGSLQCGPDPTGALGWGFGVGVVRRKTHIAESPGTYSWTGGMGTSWANDPVEGLVGILLTNQALQRPVAPADPPGLLDEHLHRAAVAGSLPRRHPFTAIPAART
jgi:CubicO group peptidase (beta-lactamase class C family)